jgi:putative addiction module killer protein
MEAEPRKIEYYKTADGNRPFIEWIMGLDAKVRHRIRTRLKYVGLGNFGDHHAEGQGIWALIFDFGPGYRVYYGLLGNTLVLLLNGGHKKRQDQDIAMARKYWEDYKANN